MISVEEAWQIIQSHIVDFGVEEIPFDESPGFVLREAIKADRDFPPFDRVAMDGIAIRFEDIAEKQSFVVRGMVAAGDPQSIVPAGNVCLEIMTGAILPIHADTVVPYEWLVIENDTATILQGKNVVKGQNVHRRGRDKSADDLLIEPGKIITSSEIGVLATIGKLNVSVSRGPKVLIVSTGNELIPIDRTPLPHQIRRSNVHQLKTLLQKLNIHADTMHLDDNKNVITETLSQVASKYDVLIICGGISAGKFDFIPTVLEELGVEKFFYKVKQKPGKPFWFGRYRSGCTVFGIPGNPVSSCLCMVRYINPWIRMCLQTNNRNENLNTVINKNYQNVEGNNLTLAKLAIDISINSALTHFIPVQLRQQPDTGILAIPVKVQGSGDLASLIGVDGFAEMIAGKDDFREGEVVNVYRLE